MNNTQVDFASRVSARAIVSGVLSAFGIMVLLMTLAGAFGFWNFDLTSIGNLTAGFWLWAFASWIVSLYVSGYVASAASRSMTPRDGLLHGFITWAAACVLGCALLAYGSAELFMGTLADSSRALFWGVFLGDLLALLAALWGGLKGSGSESRVVARMSRRQTFAENGFGEALTSQ